MCGFLIGQRALYCAVKPFTKMCSAKKLLLTSILKRFYSQSSSGPEFGFFFDIDGVFIRGRSVLPEAREAFMYLLDRRGRWRIPTIFVTNAGNTLKKNKADALSEKFNVRIHPDQIVMSHSPLSMLTQFHDKHVLLCGQGPVRQIAHNLGFHNVTTMDELSAQFPQLDVCDHNRRRAAPCAFERYNRRIEAVVLFGEPVKWETSLQLLLDILLSNGQPYANYSPNDIITSSRRTSPGRGVRRGKSLDDAGTTSLGSSSTFPYPHTPVLACNMDLTWMAEAPLPRMAHGSFLVCLESLYEKMSGHRLLYTSLLGKPSETTYYHAEYRLQQMAHELRSLYIKNQRPVRRIYCVGDNPHTDVYGANLYQRYLGSQQAIRRGINQITKHAMLSAESAASPEFSMGSSAVAAAANSDTTTSSWTAGLAEECASILVCTGIYQKKQSQSAGSNLSVESVIEHLKENSSVNHHHRDFPDFEELKIPQFVAENVSQAVRDVLVREHFPLNC